MRSERGFTLLELMIAIAILTVVLASVYITQSSSLFSSVRTKNTLIATNLARTMLARSELKFAGVKFDTLPEEEEGDFPDPYKGFSWKRKIAEIDFDALADLLVAKQKETDKSQGQDSFGEADAEIVKYFQDFMKKSVRKLTLTIQWSEGSEKTSLDFTMLLVNYDIDFATGI